MAEIKSTLELVMERTRHLTLTEEEKREQALVEFRKSLGGLIQKFQDGALTLEHFKTDLRLLQKNSCLTDKGIILDEISRRLDLDGDNTWALDLLAEAFEMSVQGIAGIFREYREAIVAMTQGRIGKIKNYLQGIHGISGTAVVPNWAADQDWVAEQQHLHDRFESALAQQVSNLKATLQR